MTRSARRVPSPLLVILACAALAWRCGMPPAELSDDAGIADDRPVEEDGGGNLAADEDGGADADAGMVDLDAGLEDTDAGMEDAGSGLPTCVQPSSCPHLSISEGSGLHAVNRCSFSLSGNNRDPKRVALIQRLDQVLPVVAPAAVAADGNRQATRLSAASVPEVTHFRTGFAWNSGDDGVTYWTPQGITGSADANASGLVGGKRIVLVSWYFNPTNAGTSYNAGVRISFVDLTDPANIRYRHALLVEPYSSNGVTTFRSVVQHAGGLVWVGDLLYVPATSTGFRVFDMSHIFRVSTGSKTIGRSSSGAYYAYDYKYVIPEIGRYTLASSSCPLTFSYASLDRSTTPPALVSGEYDATAFDGMLVRWRVFNGGISPEQAWAVGQNRAQGGLTWARKTYLSCSSQKGTNLGKLYKVGVGSSTTHGYPRGVEDLYYEPGRDELWTNTEVANDRYAFSVQLP